MEQGTKRWIIKDSSGRITGPFTTEKILYKIGRGEFTGEESIAYYPGGKWMAISTDPQFYDRLLEVLAAKENIVVEHNTEILDFTRPKDATQTGTSDDITKDVEITPTPEVEAEIPPIQPPPPKKKARPKDIEMEDARPMMRRALAKSMSKPILATILGALVLSLFWVTSEPKEERVHLIAPQKKIAQEQPQTLKDRLSSAVHGFVRDTFENYLTAQNDFVYVVERDNKNREAMALLCMTYLELWPFAYQDTSDFKVISSMVQMSSMADPGGIHAATCRAVDLIVRGRYPEAKSLAESMLEERANQETKPPIIFYYLKGYLLANTGENGAAIGYLSSAQKLWPAWIHPYVVEAQTQMKLEKYNEASNILRKVLQANPDHVVARIELGLMEYKYFNRYESAEQLLQESVSRSASAPRVELSRAYFGLAEISLKRGNQSQALKYAQKSFSLNSSYTVAKNLIVQLGGVEKLRNTKIKGQQLVLEGDQFFREGDCQAAQAHYKAAFEEEPKNAVAAMKAAQCLWKLSFSTEATEWLNKAIRSDPKLIEAYVLMADYYSQRFNFMSAAKILEQAQKINPRSHEVLRGFALIELRRGNANGAIAFLKKALLLYETDVDSHILMAKCYLALRDFRMAFSFAAKAIEIDVNNREAQTTYGEALAGYQGLDAGVDYLSRLVASYGLVVEYRLALAKILMADERYSQAEEVLRQLIEFKEKPKEAFVYLAKTLRAQGEMQEALDLLIKAAVLDPADAEPLYIAGTIYLDTKKPMEAQTQFNRVLRINKLFPLVHYQLGRAALLTGDARLALQETALEKAANPNLADAYLLTAEAHSALQQYSLCAGEYQRAIKLRPQTSIIYVKIAQCYRKSGNLDAAMDMLNVAYSQESGLADIYKEQGAIYEVKGDTNRAIEAYRQNFVLDPDAPDRQQIEDRINTLQRGGSR
jgi:tetratricopeptide (TPR) repeat protein